MFKAGQTVRLIGDRDIYGKLSNNPSFKHMVIGALFRVVRDQHQSDTLLRVSCLTNPKEELWAVKRFELITPTTTETSFFS